MAKKSKKEPVAEAQETPAAPKAPRRKKKDEAAPLLNGEAADAPAEPVAPSEPPVEGKTEAPRPKRGKRKKSDAEAPAPVEAEPEAEVVDVSDAETLVDLPAVPSDTGEVPTETPNAETPADAPAPVVIDWDELARTVEALLFAAEEPLQARELGRCSGSDSATIRKLIPKIRDRYEAERRPWDILETGTGWRMVTRPEFYPAIQRLKTQTLQRKLTQAGLETLALIAYRQPISRAEVENVRGVGAGAVLRQLLERKLIKISGRGTGLGQPLLYGTTDYFLEHFGLKSLQDLPKPNEFKQ